MVPEAGFHTCEATGTCESEIQLIYGMLHQFKMVKQGGNSACILSIVVLARRHSPIFSRMEYKKKLLFFYSVQKEKASEWSLGSRV